MPAHVQTRIVMYNIRTTYMHICMHTCMHACIVVCIVCVHACARAVRVRTLLRVREHAFVMETARPRKAGRRETRICAPRTAWVEEGWSFVPELAKSSPPPREQGTGVGDGGRMPSVAGYRVDAIAVEVIAAQLGGRCSVLLVVVAQLAKGAVAPGQEPANE